MLGDDDEIWADVTEFLDFGTGRTISIARGRDNPLDRYDSGTCSVPLYNGDGRFDPNNLDGPYVSAGASLIRPMCRVRIRCIDDTDTERPLYQGYADEWAPDLRTPNNPSRTLKAHDALKILAAIDPAEGVPVGSGEDSGARIDRILDVAMIPAGDRSIAAGDSTLQSTTLAQNLLSEAYLTADSEFGALFVDAENRVVFKNRRAIFTEERSRFPLWTFDIGDPDALPFTALQPSDDDKLVRNRVMVARAGGSLVTINDATSQAIYLPRTFNRRDLLLETDDEVEEYAERIAYLYSTHDYRFESITIDPYLDDRLWDVVLQAQLRDRITVVERNPGVAPVERECFIEGIRHTIGARAWLTQFSLAPAGLFDGLILGDTDYGILGEDRLAAL